MTRLLARLALVLVGVFSAVVGGIGAAPADMAPLREIFLPSDCAAPCVLGIAVRNNSVGEATARLEADGTVEAQVQYRVGGYRRYRMVNWGGYLFYPFQRGGLLDMSNSLEADATLVDTLFIRPKTPPHIGDLYLSLGSPDRLAYAYWYHDLGTRASLILHWYYADDQVTLITRHLCPVSRAAFWQTPLLSVRYTTQPTETLPEISLNRAIALRDCRAG
jgi:hypothetical protein